MRNRVFALEIMYTEELSNSDKFQPVASFDCFNRLYHGIANSNIDMKPDKKCGHRAVTPPDTWRLRTARHPNQKLVRRPCKRRNLRSLERQCLAVSTKPRVFHFHPFCVPYRKRRA